MADQQELLSDDVINSILKMDIHHSVNFEDFFIVNASGLRTVVAFHQFT